MTAAIYQLDSPIFKARAIAVSIVLHAVVLMNINWSDTRESLTGYTDIPIINLELAQDDALDTGDWQRPQEAVDQGSPELAQIDLHHDGEELQIERQQHNSHELTQFAYIPEYQDQAAETQVGAEADLGEAERNYQWQEIQPHRIRKLDANSDLNSVEALYFNRWQAKIQSVGAIYLPLQFASVNDKLHILVQIHSSGKLRDVRILQSSGDYELDLAALQIVRLATPYAPFPAELAEQYDVIEIVRKWSFQSSATSRAL